MTRMEAMKWAWTVVLLIALAYFGGCFLLVEASDARPTMTTSHDYWPGCKTQACNRRVGARIRKRRRERWLWWRFKARPMPACTWIPESGPLSRYGQWARARYRAKNPTSTAGGKFQALRQTWLAYGGRDYHWRWPAAYAPPLEQEKVARRILAGQGLGAWVKC